MKRYEIITYLDTKELTEEQILDIAFKVKQVLSEFGYSPELFLEGTSLLTVDIKFIENI